MRPIAHLTFRLIFVLIVPVISLYGCSPSEQEIQIKKDKEFLVNTTNADWSDKVPLDDLVTAAQLCKSGNYPDECAVVVDKLRDISISLSSCKSDPRSTLCKAVIARVGQHNIVTILPPTKAISLPDDPWYRSLPTAMLEAKAWSYGYRIETCIWWLMKWESPILIAVSCAALLFLVYRGWTWWTGRIEEKERSARISRQRQAQQRETALKLQAEKKSQQAEIQNQQENQVIEGYKQEAENKTVTAEQTNQQSEQKLELQMRQAAELKANQQEHAAAQAKLKTEQAEVKAILEIAFPRKIASEPSKQIAGNVLE